MAWIITCSAAVIRIDYAVTSLFKKSPISGLNTKKVDYRASHFHFNKYVDARYWGILVSFWACLLKG